MVGRKWKVLLRDAESTAGPALLKVPGLITASAAQVNDGADSQTAHEAVETAIRDLSRSVYHPGDHDVQIRAREHVDEIDCKAEEKSHADTSTDRARQR